jgi:hypothetical protein
VTDELAMLIEKTREYRMTDEERWLQRLSLAYGNANIRDRTVTMEEIQDAARRIVDKLVKKSDGKGSKPAMKEKSK